MRRYKARSGVVQTEICGEYLLVAAKAAREFCPFVTVLNESAVFVWKQLASGATLPELEAAVTAEFEMEDPEETRRLLLGMLEQLEQNGYLLPEEQGGEHEE